MKNYLYFFLLFWLFACKKNNTSDPVSPPVVNNHPPQYGVPFANVPSAKDAAVYQVNIRSFSAAGNLQGILPRLDSIKALGINVIYLMPVYPVGQVNAFNSPYCINDFKAVGAEFGNLTSLRAVTDASHAKGMAVVLDFVANHTAWDHPWISQHPNWYQRNAAGQIVHPSTYTDVAQLNFNNDSMKLALIEAMRYWVYAANIDGFRMDFADNVPYAFWKQANDSLRAIATHRLLLIAEGSRSDHFNAGFDMKYGFGFYSSLKQVYNGSNVSALATQNSAEYTGASAGNYVLRYTSNHDVNGSEGVPQQVFKSMDGAVGAFIITSLMKGSPMIYNGQEIGLQYSLPFPFTNPKINWSSVDAGVLDSYKKIIAFRNSSEAAKSLTYTDYSATGIVAFSKQAGSDKLLAVVNVRNAPQAFSVPPVLQAATVQNILSGEEQQLNGTLQLEPFGHYIFRY